MPCAQKVLCVGKGTMGQLTGHSMQGSFSFCVSR